MYNTKNLYISYLLREHNINEKINSDFSAEAKWYCWRMSY